MKELKLKMCEICQQTAYIKDIKVFIESLKSFSFIEKYAYIIHDYDEDEDERLKAEHIHIMVRFKYAYNVYTLAKKLNLAPQYIRKIQSRRYEDALLYLTHANTPEKHQYTASAVTANFDYASVCVKYQQRKESRVSSNEKEEVTAFCDDIIEGKIKRYNYFDLIPSDLCVRYRQRFENAFKVRDDKMKSVPRTLEVMYFTGDSGTGKTTLAKKIATEQGYSFYISSASNDLLDGFAGQECLILDDLRPSCLSLSDLLKLLDNNTASTAKSRYYNKVLECKLIIVTTVISIEDFFSTVFKEKEEPLVQLKRRCSTMFVFSQREIKVYLYDSSLRDYQLLKTLCNPIAELYPAKPLDNAAVTEKLKNLLGSDYKESATPESGEWLQVDFTELPFD